MTWHPYACMFLMLSARREALEVEWIDWFWIWVSERFAPEAAWTYMQLTYHVLTFVAVTWFGQEQLIAPDTSKGWKVLTFCTSPPQHHWARESCVPLNHKMRSVSIRWLPWLAFLVLVRVLWTQAFMRPQQLVSPGNCKLYFRLSEPLRGT